MNKEKSPIKENHTGVEARFDGYHISVVAEKNMIEKIAQLLLDASENKKDVISQINDCFQRGVGFNGDLEIYYNGKKFLIRMLIGAKMAITEGHITRQEKFEINLGGGGNLTPIEIMKDYFYRATGIEIKEE